MTYVLDTNVLLGYLRGEPFLKSWLRDLETNVVFAISAVSVGELMSIGKQRNWADAKYNQIPYLASQFLIIPIESIDLMEKYAVVDAYSQGKLQGMPLPTGVSARNMGKNDLWIAATASLLEATLITTDKDFAHLEGVFFPILNYMP